MKIINKIVCTFMKRSISEVKYWLNHPHDAQKQTFDYLIKTAQNTTFGKKYHFTNIKNVEDFKRQVPINDYDSLKDLIQDNLKGKQNVLWPEPIHWFAMSSGTTSDKSKFVPVSPSSMKKNHYKAGRELIATYLHNKPTSNLFAGRTLIMGGSHNIASINQQAKYGDLSAVLLQNMPFIGRTFMTPELPVLLMDKWEKKIEAIANRTIKQSLTNVSGVPTWVMVLFKHILQKTNKSNILEVWPALELYMHGGVSFTPYRQQFEQILPSEKVSFIQSYNASEAFLGFQDTLKTDRHDMALLMNHGTFYEFLPLDQLGEKHPKTLQLSEVQTGVNYAIVISTNAGLWRYLIGDTVQFSTLNPYRIKVSGRTKHFINAFGEEIIIDNADKAVAKACQITKGKIKEYTAAPIYFSEDKKGSHEWLIEFEKTPTDLEAFRVLLDQNLQQLNSDYEAKRRKDMAMTLPVLTTVPDGTFHEWLKIKGKLGGQHKVPRLANNRRFLEEIKSLVTS